MIDVSDFTKAAPLRVSIYSRFYYPSTGGVEVTTHLLATALRAAARHVEVLTLTPLGNNAEVAAPYAIRRLKAPLFLPGVVRKSDVVVVKGGLSFPGVWAAWLARKPLIVWHEMHGPLAKGLSAWKRLLYRLYGGAIVLPAVHVAVTEACLASKLLPPRCRTAVIYNPVSPELARSASAQPSLFKPDQKCWDLLFVGRLVESKGIAVFVEALSRLDADGCRASVGIVGEGPLQALINTKLMKCPNIKVTFMGAVQHATLGAAYAGSGVLIYPSIRPEGMGLVPAEAMTFGVPVVASNYPAVSEVVGDAGLFAAPGDVNGLAEAIRKLLMDNALREGLACKALARAAKFTFSKFSLAVTELVADVCQSTRGRQPLRSSRQ